MEMTKEIINKLNYATHIAEDYYHLSYEDLITEKIISSDGEKMILIMFDVVKLGMLSGLLSYLDIIYQPDLNIFRKLIATFYSQNVYGRYHLLLPLIYVHFHIQSNKKNRLTSRSLIEINKMVNKMKEKNE